MVFLFKKLFSVLVYDSGSRRLGWEISTMTVEITLFGFGEDCPPGFQRNTLQLSLNRAEGLKRVLNMAGLDNLDGLVLLVNNRGVSASEWSKTRIIDNDSIKVLSAIEGG